MKKSDQPPSGVLPGWKKAQKTQKSDQLQPGVSHNTQQAEEESAVRYGGVLADSEDDDIERSAINKTSRRKGRAIVSNISFNV
jgi:hypothetical protein